MNHRIFGVYLVVCLALGMGCLPDEKPIDEATDRTGGGVRAGAVSGGAISETSMGGTSTRGRSGGQSDQSVIGGASAGERSPATGGSSPSGGTEDIGGEVGGEVGDDVGGDVGDNVGGEVANGGATGGIRDLGPCENNDTETRACGLNNRGTAQRICADGQWQAWTSCIDVDQCIDAATESAACGLDGSGAQRRRCEEGQWGEYGVCMGGAVCLDEQREFASCGTNGRGVQIRECVGGAWQDFNECDDPDLCSDDAIENEACGVNGNGTATRLCVGGRWTPFGACDDPDERCESGDVDIVMCGVNGRGTIERTCVDNRWQLTGTCSSRDVCVDLARESLSCGLNDRGRQARSCVAGQWSQSETCDDPDACVDDVQEAVPCGPNERGSSTRQCVDGQWTIFGPCADADICLNGDIVGDQVCGLNGRGRVGRPCIDGQWADEQCVDPDECVDDTVGMQTCGRQDDGDQQRNCVDGTWTNWSPCVGGWVCPDVENPLCGPARAERCNGLDEDHDGVVDEGLIPVDDGDGENLGAEPCVETPFGQSVANAIERGLQWVRNQEAGLGHINDQGARSNFLAVLAFLGQPSCAGKSGPGVGYAGLEAEDQALVVRLVRALIDSEGSMTDGADTPYVYVTGGNLSALSQYISTGGPDEVGSAVTVTEAIQNGVIALQNNQGNQAPNNLGGWNYGTPEANGDLSTTHFAGLGLSAASRVFDGADAPLANVVNFLMAGQQPDGGSGYRPGDASSSSMTAAALRLYRLAGVTASDPRAQAALRWLKTNWAYEGMVGGNFQQRSTYYYFWAAYKALALSADDGLGGEIFASDFGERDPVALGYPEEPASFYFDFAYTLLQWQNPQTGVWGQNGNPSPNNTAPSPGGWSEQSSTFFALLLLERFGVATDSQLEVDARRPHCSDGLDNDGDGLIDMADPECIFPCTSTERPVAACRNQRDDDDDGLIDFPDDRGCYSIWDDDEGGDEGAFACLNQIDDDGDGLVDFPEDPGCLNPSDDTETSPACGNGVDDDNDGRVDYPNDPGCTSTEGVSENDPESPLACADGEDNDEDGQTDFPDDAGCLYAADNSEQSVCPDGVRVEVYPVGAPFLILDTSAPMGDGVLSGGEECESAGSEVVLVYDAPQAASLNVRVDHPETNVPTVVYATERCDSPTVAIGCGISSGEERRALPLRVSRPTRFFIVIDHPGPMGGGQVKVSIDVTRAQAACDDGIDNDNDGRVDLQDPGCTSPGDISEVDTPDQPPVCNDGQDNDGDDLIDFPRDPGCAFPGDGDETDSDEIPACANGLDDDRDMRIDFPLDPGCASANDDEEADGPLPPACADGIDNDDNGYIDFPEDPGCRFAGDTAEISDNSVRPRCDDSIDNDLDGRIDLDDPGCTRPLDNDETDPPVLGLCVDGIDNDGDGQTDYPDDPGCTALGDACEEPDFGLCDGVCQQMATNDLHCGRCHRRCPPGVACQDGRCGPVRQRFILCGEGEGVNYRNAETYQGMRLVAANVAAETGCEPADDVQAILLTYSGRANVINSPQRYLDYLERGGQIITSRQTSHDVYNALFGTDVPRPAQRLGGQCAGNVQNTYQYSPNNPFWLDTPFLPLSPNLAGCGYPINNLPDVTLLAGWTEDEASLGYLNVDAGRIWFVESNWFEERDTFTDASFYMMESMILGSGSGGMPPCLDGKDNDGDGLIDLFDPGCTSRDDGTEGEVAGEPACADTIDNDGDGAIDYPLDTGCLAAGDTSEVSPDSIPRCANGLDDDNDGKPDYPHDPGCSSRADDVETDEERPARCANGRDDDGDGLVDYPADPGCSAAIDEDETDDAVEPACANGRDDDGDGISDWPFDPGCLSAADETENDDPAPTQCFNGVDDDDDGQTDFPADPGCLSAGDPLEDSAGPLPACANEEDDDGDNLIDFPADRGCAYAADDSEVDPFVIPARCNDGVDNDGDGIIDLYDQGCANREDDDETDGDDVPLCANQMDDDEDGLIDWPADPGCQARGDAGEEQACGEMADAVLIARNGTVNDSTLEDGPDAYVSSRCGGRGAAEKVFKYVLEEPVDQLTFDADFDESEYAVVLSVRRDCNEPLSELQCVGDGGNPNPTIRLQNPDVGAYYVFVDGGGLELWQPSPAPVNMPADPRGFMARDDLNDRCWQDGGNDAFDCFGRPALTFDGDETALNTRATDGNAREIDANGFVVDVESGIANNVWQFTIRPAIPGDDRPVSLRFSGDLGSDGNTESTTATYPYRGRNFTMLHTRDSGDNDPPVTMFLLTSRPDEAMSTEYTVVGDDVTIENPRVRLPATLYVALSYGPRGAVAQALLDHVAVEIGGRDPDRPTFGQFQLRVTEEVIDVDDEPAEGGQLAPGGQPAAGGQPAPGGRRQSGGSADAPTGGAAGSPAGGTAGSPSGGAAGSPTGGTAGSPSGGAAGSPSGGAAGLSSGDAAGSPPGGSPGGSAGPPSGGLAGPSGGGTTASGAGDVAGSALGGSTSPTAGGSSATGGDAMGGRLGSAGAAGAGGGN
ncbi:MAG: hypothetical protein VX589_02165 [Myxococcota bacterium]|nr:hypothetical protein [Myxococcota bacterium]